MGGQSSKNDDTVGALKVFDSDEIREIKSLFLRIAENHPAASLTHIQNHLRPILPSDVVKRCFTSMVKLSKGHQNAVTLQGFSVYLTHILKGTAAEKAEIVLALASDSDQVSDSSLLQFFSQLVSSYIKTIEKGKQFQSWKFSQEDRWVNSFSLYLLQDLLKSEESTTESAVFRPDEVELWLSRCPLAIHVLDVVFHSSFNIHQSEEVASRYLTPLLPSINVDWSTMQTILDVPSLIMLCHNLPAELRTQWRPLYSNGKHGDSFSQLLTRVIKQGPTVLVVRDKDGHVFGGFSSVAWDVRPQFVGSPTCFLFSLSPKFDVFTTTGYNDHYMYLNNGVQTMPNGLGMGGQLEYFGLWIDQSFNVGHSKAGPRCTTYDSPQLSKSAEFEVDVIEVWGVGPEPKREEKEGEVSILDKDPEGKAMLSLIDRGPVSEGLREADATAGSPSEHELPPL